MSAPGPRVPSRTALAAVVLLTAAATFLVYRATMLP
jgi:hypothetical protein